MRSALAVVLLAACGGPSSGPDAGEVQVDAGALGTWDDPIAIGALPYLATGDTRGAPAAVAAYTCAPAIDEAGGEVVYALDVAAPTTLRLGLDDRPDEVVDVDLHVVSGAPDACVVRADRALEVDLEPGAWSIIIDTYQDLAGPYALSIVRANPGQCLVNPLPGCDSAPEVNGVPVEPPGVGGCPAGMTPAGAACIDRWEAALVEDTAGGPIGHSPYANPGTRPVRAVSAPGVVPQGYISGTQAAAACSLAGKRLCTDTEWLRACQGAAGHTFPYGDARIPAACNDARACHPAVQYFESSDASVFSMIQHPCLGQLPDGLAPTGSYATCASDDGAYDLMGNLHEWTSDPAGTFRGGFFVDTEINGAGCLYRTTAHDTAHWDYSTGFRCCADLP